MAKTLGQSGILMSDTGGMNPGVAGVTLEGPAPHLVLADRAHGAFPARLHRFD